MREPMYVKLKLQKYLQLLQLKMEERNSYKNTMRTLRKNHPILNFFVVNELRYVFCKLFLFFCFFVFVCVCVCVCVCVGTFDSQKKQTKFNKNEKKKKLEISLVNVTNINTISRNSPSLRVNCSLNFKFLKTICFPFFSLFFSCFVCVLLIFCKKTPKKNSPKNKTKQNKTKVY